MTAVQEPILICTLESWLGWAFFYKTIVKIINITDKKQVKNRKKYT